MFILYILWSEISFFSNILYIDGTIPGCEKIIVVFKTLLF